MIDFSILADENELFIALNPATHKFDLSRFNKAGGKKLSILEKEQGQQLTDNLVVNNTKARQLLGWQPTINTIEGLQEIID